MVLVKNASCFAPNLAVQRAGQALLRQRGIELVPVEALTYFTDPPPTIEMVRQILDAVLQFEKVSLVAKLRARDRKRAETGRCEGRRPVPTEEVAEACRLARGNPKTGNKRSLREIAGALAVTGMMGPSGRTYFAASVAAMLKPANRHQPDGKGRGFVAAGARRGKGAVRLGGGGEGDTPSGSHRSVKSAQTAR
jgi:hypothetical protein